MKRSRYPRNWPALALACKELAGWMCEECGVAHGVALRTTLRNHDPSRPCPWLKKSRNNRSGRKAHA